MQLKSIKNYIIFSKFDKKMLKQIGKQPPLKLKSELLFALLAFCVLQKQQPMAGLL